MKRSPFVLAVAVLLLAGIAGAGGLAYLFLRGAPPAAVSLDPGSSQPIRFALKIDIALRAFRSATIATIPMPMLNT